MKHPLEKKKKSKYDGGILKIKQKKKEICFWLRLALDFSKIQVNRKYDFFFFFKTDCIKTNFSDCSEKKKIISWEKLSSSHRFVAEKTNRIIFVVEPEKF